MTSSTLRTGKNTCTSPRCASTRPGGDARCVLPEGHAAAHTDGSAEWPSEASEAIAELLDAQQELQHIKQKLRSVIEELRADLTMPTAAHSPAQMYSWFQEQFPSAFPSVRSDLTQHARRVARKV
jgi:hypothetical protein